MKERPILFSAPMVRAILAGNKTQTRRVVKPVGNDDGFVLQDYGDGWWPYRSDDGDSPLKNGNEVSHDCPYGQPGDRLWVRETFQQFSEDGEIMYKADPASFDEMNKLKFDEHYEARWRPSIHMPRWASRILLEITDVRVERLKDISNDDAKAEGAGCNAEGNHRMMFEWIWQDINGRASWDANPWVWVVEFKRVTA